MENLDALLTDLQAATSAMMALNDFHGLTGEATAAEDTCVDATWGSEEFDTAATPLQFPRLLPAATTTSSPFPANDHNGWQNGFNASERDRTGLPSPLHSKKQSAQTTVRENAPAGSVPILYGPREVVKDHQHPPARAADSVALASYFGTASVSAAATAQAVPGSRARSPVAVSPTGRVGVALAFEHSGNVATTMFSDSTVSPRHCSRASPDVGQDLRGTPVPALPPPPSRDIVDSFYRDMAANESLYEVQNLTAHQNMSSPAAAAESGAVATAELRWRAPHLRTQSTASGASPIVRSSLAHNLCELDALLHELGAAPQQHATFSTNAAATAPGSSASAAAQLSRTPSSAHSAEGTPVHHPLYAPVKPRATAGATAAAEQQQSQLTATGMLQSEAERRRSEQQAFSPAATAGVDPASTSRQQQQQTASFATRELDELMATLSLLKVNNSVAGNSSAVSSPQTSKAASSMHQQLTEDSSEQQQQQYARIRPPAALPGGPRSPGNQQSQSTMGTSTDRQQLQQPPILNGQAIATRWTGSPSANGSATSSALSSPRSPRGDLDNMLGHLETDLSRQGAGVVTKGHCAACDKAVVGQVVTALGRLWHPEHFCCTECRCELARVSFFERDGKPYCERDYHELFAPKCARCGDPVISKCVTALGITWHPECFSCAACGRPLADEGFHEKDGSVYCVDDFFDLFSPRCGSCGMPIYDNFVAALNRHWHPACFACMDCGAAFAGSSFFDHDGMPYCETHYHSRKGSLCAGCQKPVSGRCIAAMSKKFHPEHFVCAFCLRQLNKGTFKEQNDKPYCHACFSKLFG